jgi:hypothetical protein
MQAVERGTHASTLSQGGFTARPKKTAYLKRALLEGPGGISDASRWSFRGTRENDHRLRLCRIHASRRDARLLRNVLRAFQGERMRGYNTLATEIWHPSGMLRSYRDAVPVVVPGERPPATFCQPFRLRTAESLFVFRARCQRYSLRTISGVAAISAFALPCESS